MRHSKNCVNFGHTKSVLSFFFLSFFLVKTSFNSFYEWRIILLTSNVNSQFLFINFKNYALHNVFGQKNFSVRICNSWCITIKNKIWWIIVVVLRSMGNGECLEFFNFGIHLTHRDLWSEKFIGLMWDNKWDWNEAVCKMR